MSPIFFVVNGNLRIGAANKIKIEKLNVFPNLRYD